MYILTAPAIN